MRRRKSKDDVRTGVLEFPWDKSKSNLFTA